jgi:hypothetical protein
MNTLIRTRLCTYIETAIGIKSSWSIYGCVIEHVFYLSVHDYVKTQKSEVLTRSSAAREVNFRIPLYVTDTVTVYAVGASMYTTTCYGYGMYQQYVCRRVIDFTKSPSTCVVAFLVVVGSLCELVAAGGREVNGQRKT